MTREEKLKAGWTELWGCRLLETDTWWSGPSLQGGQGWSTRKNRRHFECLDEATRFANGIKTNGVYACRYWKKPKAPPRLAVGDEVAMRGVVKQVDKHPTSGWPEVLVQFGNTAFWTCSDKCERVKS